MKLASTIVRSSLALIFAAATANGQQFSRMLVFGDSLSDTGTSLHYTTNINNWTLGTVSIRPVGPNYAHGRWTNGAIVNYGALNLANTHYDSIWHWKLADTLGIQRAQNYHTNPVNKNNFAAGGAVTGMGQQTTWGFTNSDNIGHQVNTFFLGTSPAMSNSTLYTLMGGGNDIRDAVRSGAAHDAPTATAVGRSAAQNIASYINALATRAHSQNVKIHVAWPNVVPMQYIPDFADAYGGNGLWRAVASTASSAFRDEWNAQINALRNGFPNHLEIYPIDFWQYFTDLHNGHLPGLGGLNMTDPILNFNGFTDWGFNPPRNSLTVVPAGANPDTYVFWDRVHPTARVHDLMGAYAASQIPAPGSLALLATALCITVRRRRVAA